MTIILIFLAALAALGLVVYLFKGKDTAPVSDARPAGCCGQHAVCEKESLLAGLSKEIEYYDDEHLDRFRCTRPEDYTEAEEAEFREVFDTMLPADVPGWVRSLQLRGIELPPALREEVILVVGEMRLSR